MSFIFITIVSVAFVVLIIHKLAAMSKARLYWRSLLACALCAVSIDLALPILSIYLPNYQFIIIILITLFAAYYIAGYNIYLDRLAEAKNCRRFFPPEEQAASYSGVHIAPPLRSSDNQNLQTFDFSALTASMPKFLCQTALTPVEPVIAKDDAAKQSVPADESKIQEPAVTVIDENALPPAAETLPSDNSDESQQEPPLADFLTDSAIPGIALEEMPHTASLEAEVVADEVSTEEVDAAPMQPAEDMVSDDKAHTAAVAEADTVLLPADAAAAPADSPANDVPDDTIHTDTNTDTLAEASPEELPPAAPTDNRIAEKLADLTELNDILDYAYELRNHNDIPSALLAFQKALQHFPTNDYMPFVVIEIGNIHKADGEYQKAIQVYEQALELPILASDETMKKEFMNNIMYLRLLQSILAEHGSQTLKYAAIPQDILQIAEAKFQQWREQHS